MCVCVAGGRHAITDYTAAIELDSSNASAFNNRGYAWRKLGDYKQAIADYTASLQLDPTNVKTFNNRAYSYAKSGAYDQAINDYSSVRLAAGFDTSR